MSGTLPNTNFNAIKFQSNQKTLFSETDSGKTFRRQVQGQKFSFTVSYPPMTRSEFAPIMAFIMKQRSRKEDFTVVFPSYLNAQGNETNTLLVNGVHAVADTTIAINGFAGDGAGRLKAGDLIKFAGHSKVYMVQDEVTASGGEATVNIQPNLVANVADNEAVTVNKPLFNVYLVSDDITYTTDASGFYNISFDVREVIE